MWRDVENKKDLPDDGEYVLTKCPGMRGDGGVMVIVAKYFDGEWSACFPYNQPVKPTHWCYSISLDSVNTR